MIDRHRFFIALCTCAVGAVAVVSARWLSSPDVGQAPPPTGTGRLAGVLLSDSASPQPIRRATVHISATGAPGIASRVVGTDDDGRFAFDLLPAGSYTLSASKPGFVETYYGAPHPRRGPGVPVKVADASRADVTLRMLPGAIITGTITDSAGVPRPGVPVTAIDLRDARTSNPLPTRATTDDLGVYRIFGLPPGDYLVSALPRLIAQTEGRGVLSSVAINAVTDAEVQWARGAMTSGGSGREIGPMPPAGTTVSYAPVYFPGTTDAAAASAVTVTAGEERAGVNMALRVVPVAQLAGKLIDETGQPVVNASVALAFRNTGQPSLASTLMYTGMATLPRGSVAPAGFTVVGVAPGDYTITARTGAVARGAVPAGQPPTLWSVLDVAVDGRDRNDLLMRMLPGSIVTGSISIDRTTLPPPPDLTKIQLDFVTTQLMPLTSFSSRAVVEASGALRFPGVPPGAYAVRVTFPPAADAASGWTLKSAMYKGRDLADGAIDLKPGDELEGLAVTLTDHPAEISGHVIDAAGQPVTRYAIAVFTTDRSQWLPNARRVRLVTPGSDGSFIVGGLPAGEYAVAAVDGADSSDLSDPAFLAQLLGSAFKTTLADGERKRQDLRVGR